MKARLEGGKIVKYSRLPKTLNANGKHYLRFDLEDDSEKESAGFYDVIVPSYDPITEVIYNLHFDNAYPSPTPDDADATREVFTYDVKAKTISETVAELKTKRIEELKKIGYDKLQPTDWMVVRKVEKGTAIPSEIQAERDLIRTSVTTKETEINALSTKAEILKFDVSF